MKIAPLAMTDPWFSHVFNHRRAYVDVLNDVPVEMTVLVDRISIDHAEPGRNYRPFLRLQGQVTSLQTPSVEMPYGITEMEMAPDAEVLLDATYDFTTEQLMELAAKGYFEHGFQVPPELTSVPWTLPSTARFVVVSPERIDDPPVVFWTLNGAHELALDQATTGYELVSYFPTHLPELPLEQEATWQPEPSIIVDEPTKDDLFAVETTPVLVVSLPDAVEPEVTEPLMLPGLDTERLSIARLRYLSEVAGATAALTQRVQPVGADVELEDDDIPEVQLYEDGIMAFEPDFDLFEEGEFLFEWDPTSAASSPTPVEVEDLEEPEEVRPRRAFVEPEPVTPDAVAHAHAEPAVDSARRAWLLEQAEAARTNEAATVEADELAFG